MVNRGEIWWAELSEPKKSEPGYKRPLVIIQSNSFNKSNINTTICAVITSNLKLADAPGNIILNPKTSGLPKDSVINISQIITIDKSFLIEKVGELTNKQINRLENSLKLILSLD
jgi:mRNA interferase MazF